MELRQFLSSVRHGWKIILVMLVLGLLVPAAQGMVVGRSYVSTAQLYVHVVSARNIDDLASAASLVQQQVSDYAELAVTPAVLTPAATSSGTGVSAGQLSQDVTATAAQNSAFLSVTATAASPQDAQRIANAVSARLVAYAAELTPTNSTTGARLVLSEVSPAGLPSSSATSTLVIELLLGGVVGILVGIAIIALRDRFRARFHTIGEIGAIARAEVLASIPLDRRAKGQAAVEVESRSPVRFDAVRALRASLEANDLLPDAGATIAVTSSVTGEGKSTTVASLAVALAATGQRVVVVDTDLRRPSVAKLFGVTEGPGLTDVLTEEASLPEVLRSTAEPNISVLTSGSSVPRASEWLASDAMLPLLMDLGEDGTIVLLDTAPLLETSDAAVVARWADHVLLVAGASTVTERELARSVAVLRHVRVQAAGVVVNQVPSYWTAVEPSPYVPAAVVQ